jgi:hypothetical protein
MSQIDPDEVMYLSERAWASWQRRRLTYFAIPLVLFALAAAMQLLRVLSDEPKDWHGIGTLVFLLAGVAALLWARTQMPLSPPRARQLLDNGLIGEPQLQKLRRQASM